MSKIAGRKLEDGKIIPVRIGEITEENRNDEYICNGRIKNSAECCTAKVIPVLGMKPHFRVDPNYKHDYNCKNDESEAAIIKRHLDEVGRNTTIEKLLEAFEKDAATLTDKGSERGGERGKEPGEKPPEGKDDDDREIKREARDPKKLKELCAILVKTDLEESYAGLPIKSIIVDNRSVKDYRAKGLSEGQMAVVLCRRASKVSLDKWFPGRNPNDIVLRDAYSYDDGANPILFIVKGNKQARDKIFTAQRDHIIAVFARWHLYSENSRTYFCDPIKGNQVFSENADFFEGYR